MVVIRQNWLYSGKSGCIWAKFYYSAKVVVIGQKRLYLDESGSIGGKDVLFGQKMLFLVKVDVFGQKWL